MVTVEDLDSKWILKGLADVYRSQGKYMQAESLYMDVLGICRHTLGENHPDTAATAEELAKFYQDWGKPDKAAEWRQKLR